MIVSFRDPETEAIYDAESTQAARRRLPDSLWKTAQRKLSQVNAVEALHELAVPPRNRLEEWKGNRKGQRSNRINDPYRICFVWTEQGPADVEIVGYH